LPVPADIQQILRRGGRGLVDFLEYCVLARQLDPIFVFLANEYRLQPTIPGAIALYDTFCPPNAPARLDAVDVLPPRNLGLQQQVERLRRQWDLTQQLTQQPAAAAVDAPTNGTEEDPQEEAAELDNPPDVQEGNGELDDTGDWIIPTIVPPRELFDFVVRRLEASLNQVGANFDPQRSPLENLPAGQLNEGQRSFVENVWKRQVRPHLVASGFRRVANIGGP
jgi:hypothetical protein